MVCERFHKRHHRHHRQFQLHLNGPKCRSTEIEWVKLDGKGELVSFTHVIARPLSFQQKEPYTIAIGKLVDGVNVLACLKDVDIADIKVGMKLKLTAGMTPDREPSYWFVPR